MKKRQRSLSIPGISLLLLIFLALCLITFSLLSLSGAVADENLSQKAADRTTSYYAASNRANDILAETDRHLTEILKQAETYPDPSAAYLQLCEELPVDIPSYTFRDNILSFSVPVTDDQVIEVGLMLTYPKDHDDTLYKISSWKIVNTGEWNPDTSLNLFQ